MVRQAAVAAALVGVLAACGGGRERIDAPTRAEARAALHADAAFAVVQVEPTFERLGGRALIAVPDRALIEATGIRADASRDPPTRRYLVDVVEVGLLANVEGLRRAELFDALTVVRDGDPQAVAIGDYDVKIWLAADAPDHWQWLVALKGGAAPAPIAYDGGRAETARLVAFTQAIVKAAETLGVTPHPRE